jgi:hypothetical protein
MHFNFITRVAFFFPLYHVSTFLLPCAAALSVVVVIGKRKQKEISLKILNNKKVVCQSDPTTN